MYPLPFGNLPLSHPSTPWNFRDPPWGGYGYFLEPHIVIIIVKSDGMGSLHRKQICIGTDWFKHFEIVIEINNY